jgi:hypothetical protein
MADPATSLNVLRVEFSKRIGLYIEGFSGGDATTTTFSLHNVADADGYWRGCWAFPRGTAIPTNFDAPTWERLIDDYASRWFTVGAAFISAPALQFIDIHQFQPTKLTDFLNWAIGDAFPEASVLQVIEMPVEADNAYTLPEAVPSDGLPMVRLLDVEYKVTTDAGLVQWYPVEFALIGNGTQFELKERLTDSATLRVRGQRRLSQLVLETDEVEVDFPKAEIIYAAAAVKLYEQAENLIPTMQSQNIDKGLALWRGRLRDMKVRHGDDPAPLRAKIPVL